MEKFVTIKGNGTWNIPLVEYEKNKTKWDKLGKAIAPKKKKAKNE
jgi:hypothetical protein